MAMARELVELGVPIDTIAKRLSDDYGIELGPVALTKALAALEATDTDTRAQTCLARLVLKQGLLLERQYDAALREPDADLQGGRIAVLVKPMNALAASLGPWLRSRGKGADDAAEDFIALVKRQLDANRRQPKPGPNADSAEPSGARGADSAVDRET